MKINSNKMGMTSAMKRGVQAKKNEGPKEQVSLGSTGETPDFLKGMKGQKAGEHSFISEVGGAVVGGLVGGSVGGSLLGPIGTAAGLVIGGCLGAEAGFAGTLFPIVGAEIGAGVGGALMAPLGTGGMLIGTLGGAFGGWMLGESLAS